jgi:hypothetical protein
MRHTIIILLACLALLGCVQDNNNRPGIDLIFRDRFDIPAGLNVFAVHHFYLRSLPTRFTNLLNQQGSTPADVTGVLTGDGALTALFGDGDFSFVAEVSIRAYKEGNVNDYIEVAYRQPVPIRPGARIDLIPSLADSKKFLQEERVSFDVALLLRDIPRQSTPVQFDLRLKAVLGE